MWVKGGQPFIRIWKLHRISYHLIFFHSHPSKSECWSKVFSLLLWFLSSPKVSCSGDFISFSSSVYLASGRIQLKFSQQMRSFFFFYHWWLFFLESLFLNGDMTQCISQSMTLPQGLPCFWKLKKKCSIAAKIWYEVQDTRQALTPCLVRLCESRFFWFGTSSKFWSSTPWNMDSCKGEMILNLTFAFLVVTWGKVWKRGN